MGHPCKSCTTSRARTCYH